MFLEANKKNYQAALEREKQIERELDQVSHSLESLRKTKDRRTGDINE